MLDFGFYNMDCMEGMRQMLTQGIRADLTLTDIPYDGVNRVDNGLRSLNKGNADIITFNLNEFLPLVDEVTKGCFVIFCGWGQLSQIQQYFESKGYSTRLLVWKKNNPSPMNGEHIYLSGVELAVYAKKKGATFNAFCKNTVFEHNAGKNEIHPTQKPLSLWYELIRDNSNEGQLVFDPCAGSGTTAVACHKLKRDFICFEVNKDYYDAASKRLNAVKDQFSMFDLDDYDSVHDAVSDAQRKLEGGQ